MEHTPGPWNWHAPLPSQGIKHFMVHEKVGDIAEVYNWDHTKASEANARLIAAAPDLLAALQEYMACVPFDETTALGRQAQAAVDKATTDAD